MCRPFRNSKYYGAEVQIFLVVVAVVALEMVLVVNDINVKYYDKKARGLGNRAYGLHSRGV